MLFLGIESNCSVSNRLNVLGNAFRNGKWIKKILLLLYFLSITKQILIVLQYD